MEKAIPMTSSNVLKKQKRMRRIRDNVELYSLILPVLIHIFIFSYIPMYGILIAFQNYTPGSPILAFDGSVKWVGLKHFVSFVTSPMFPRLFYNTFHLSFLNLAFGFLCPILFALLVNELKDNFFKKFLQTTSYMPYFISSVVVAGMVLSFLNADGILNQFLALFNVPPKAYNTLPKAFPIFYTVTCIWKSFGWGSILYLSTISSIDPGLYESAKIDGANRLQRCWYVTLPHLSNLIIIQLIFCCMFRLLIPPPMLSGRMFTGTVSWVGGSVTAPPLVSSLPSSTSPCCISPIRSAARWRITESGNRQKGECNT